MLESQAAFARRKNWNRSTASRYAKAGKIVIDEKSGLVNVEASEQRLKEIADPLKEGVRQRHQEQRQARGGERDPDGDLRVDPKDTTYQLLTKHRAAAEWNRAELLRLELEEKEGHLVDADVVRRRAMQLARSAREAVTNLRFRIDPLLAGEADPLKRAEIWDRELRQICEELGRGTAAPLEQTSGGG